MAKISDLPLSADLSGAETLVAVQGGETVKVPLDDVVERTASEAAAIASSNMMVRGGGALVQGAQPLGVIGVEDADKIFRIFISMMADGSIRSAAINALVTGQLGGYRFSVGSVKGFSLALLQEAADGRFYVIAGRRNDGSWYPSSATAVARTCYHIVMLGQSNAAADAATPVISTAPTGWGNKKFQRGVNTHVIGDHNADPQNRAAGGFALVNLTESGVETRATGLADTLKMLLTGRSRHDAPTAEGDYVLVSSTATGSRRLADLGPLNDRSEGQYLAMLDDIARAKAAAEARGDRYVLLGMIYDQGEKEGAGQLTDSGPVLSNSALIAGYKAQALQLVESFDTAARAITAQAGPFLTFVTPASANVLTSEAWAQTARQSHLVRIVSGRGVFQSALHNNRSDTAQAIHYSPDSQRTDLAERCARAIFTEHFLAEAHRPPVAVRAVKLSATSVRIDFDSRYPLEIDTTTMPPAIDMGVTLRGGTLDAPGGAIRATALEVVGGGRSVIAAVPSVPAGALLTIGLNSVTALAVPAAAGVDAATADPIDAGGRYKVAVAGDLRAALQPLTDLGHFSLYGSAPVLSQGVIRWVEYDADANQTILTGRVAERRTGGDFVAFQAGQTLSIGHSQSYANIRDDSPARSRTAYQQGARAGRYPALHNWTINRTGIPVEGA